MLECNVKKKFFYFDKKTQAFVKNRVFQLSFVLYKCLRNIWEVPFWSEVSSEVKSIFSIILTCIACWDKLVSLIWIKPLCRHCRAAACFACFLDLDRVCEVKWLHHQSLDFYLYFQGYKTMGWSSVNYVTSTDTQMTL